MMNSETKFSYRPSVVFLLTGLMLGTAGTVYILQRNTSLFSWILLGAGILLLIFYCYKILVPEYLVKISPEGIWTPLFGETSWRNVKQLRVEEKGTRNSANYFFFLTIHQNGEEKTEKVEITSMKNRSEFIRQVESKSFPVSS